MPIRPYQYISACVLLLFSLAASAKDALPCPPVDQHGQRRIDAEAILMLAECSKQNPTTKSLHFDSVTQQYSPQRQTLHNSIINNFLKDRPCVKLDSSPSSQDQSNQPPIAILTGGIAASGKTTFLKKHYPWVLSKNVVMINSDDIRELLPEYQGWDATSTYNEASDISKKLMQKAIETSCKHHLAYDSTMSNQDYYVQLIPRLKKLGYRVLIIYLQVPPEVAAQRVLKRYQREGRYVPVDILDDMSKKSISVFNSIKSDVDGYIVVNGENGEVIEQHGQGIPRHNGLPTPPPPRAED